MKLNKKFKNYDKWFLIINYLDSYIFKIRSDKRFERKIFDVKTTNEFEK